MKTSLIPFVISAFVAMVHGSLAAGEIPPASDSRFVRIREELLKLEAEADKLPGLTMRFENPRRLMPSSHEFHVKLRDSDKAVVESWEAEGVRLEKACFLQGQQARVVCVEHRLPCLDGELERVTEQWIYLEEGRPFARAVRSRRVPAGEDFEDQPSVPVPNAELPPDWEAWTQQMHARAFDILRAFPPGRSRDLAWGWTEADLTGAPPAGSSQPALRNKDWLPPAGTLVLPIPRSDSTDGFFGIGWGYESGPVDWAFLKADHGCEDLGEVYFSSKLAPRPLPEPLGQDANFLVRMPEARPVGKTGTSHPGERQRFNHDELLVHWSPSSRCAVVMETEKWFTQTASLVWIKNGQVEAANDVLVPLRKAAHAALRKSKHPAAKRGVEEDYEFTLVKMMVEDDGSFEALVQGQVPKDWSPAGLWQVRIDGHFSAVAGEEPAGLVTKKVKVLPPVKEDP